MIKVFLVDDDPTYREGLRQLLSLAGDLKVVGEAASAEEACALGARARPDVILLDADLPRSGCIETIMKLASSRARVDQLPSVICLAVYPDQHDAALQAGAVRFLRKDGSARELIEAVRLAGRARQVNRDEQVVSDPNPAWRSAAQGF